MNNKNKLRTFIALVILLVVITVKGAAKDNYTLVTTQGCCTIDVKYHDNMYTIKYNDNVTDYTETVVEYTECNANWTISEMMHDYCNHHESNRGH